MSAKSIPDSAVIDDAGTVARRITAGTFGGGLLVAITIFTAIILNSAVEARI